MKSETFVRTRLEQFFKEGFFHYTVQSELKCIPLDTNVYCKFSLVNMTDGTLY